MINNIFVATSSFDMKNLANLANGTNIEFIQNPLSRKLEKSEIVKYCTECSGVIAGTEVYSKEVLDKLTNLKVISRLGVGTDNIDINEAKKRNIIVFTTQTTPAPAVVELTLGLIIDVARKISLQNNNLKNNKWKKFRGNLVQKKKMGIIGLGNIGKNLVELCKGFNLEISAYDMFHDNEFASENKINYCDLDTLLSTSDIITVHLNLTNQTNNLLNAEKLKKMKPDSILINTSRGEIIDEGYLYQMLYNRKILGAGLDVFHNEPYNGPLSKLDNVVLTPHIGAYAKEIRARMEIEAVKNIVKGLNNGK